MVIKLKSPKASAPEAGNPLKTDEELVGLLGRLDKIKTWKRFQGWKQSFLDRLDTFLVDRGVDYAQKASGDFKKAMDKNRKYVDQCNAMIEKGDLTNEKVTVKGRNSLNELVKNMDLASNETETLIPKTQKDEKTCGYNKFELGAVLVRDGFTCFDNMAYLNDSVMKMSESLSEVADRQQLDAFEYYQKKFKNFCDIMADLGLYELMMACRKFAVKPEFDEPDMIEITIKASNGETIELEVDSSETIGSIKDVIADACGIPASKQILKFKRKTLDNNDHTLDACGIEDKSVLTVEPPTIPITVNTMGGKKITMDIDPTRPLAEIKKKLQDETGLSPGNQRLSIKGGELSDDNKTAEDYFMVAGLELDLEPKAINVNVETPEGKTIAIKVKPSDTVDDIKNQLEGPSGILVPKQVLEFKDAVLPSDGKTVTELGIREGNILKLKPLKVPITVKTYDGKDIQVMIDPDDSLGDIKNQLEEETGLPVSKIHLYMNGKELDDDDKKASDCGIKPNSVLDMLRVIFFVDEETGYIGKLPIDRITGGRDFIDQASANGSTRNALKQRIQQILGD
mmetsp:Transcript_2169/g.4262  ORF Transcript_2169/g.4262 Transcript_2169/m.4262 type:complete len:568 (-) Transcript_2169:73-1776(-)